MNQTGCKKQKTYEQFKQQAGLQVGYYCIENIVPVVNYQLIQ